MTSRPSSSKIGRTGKGEWEREGATLVEGREVKKFPSLKHSSVHRVIKTSVSFTSEIIAPNLFYFILIITENRIRCASGPVQANHRFHYMNTQSYPSNKCLILQFDAMVKYSFGTLDLVVRLRTVFISSENDIPKNR